MKKIITLFLAVFLLIGTLGFVFAENATDDVTNETEEAEVEEPEENEVEFEEVEIPEAKKTGFMKRMRFAFTFNKEKKIEMALEIAEEKLAYADLIAEENPEEAEKIYAEYEKFVEKAKEILEKIKSKSDNENESSEEIGKLVRLQNKFEKHQEHTDAIYARALARFEINNASPEKIARFENFYVRATKKNEEVFKRALNKKENAIKKHKVLTEISDSELGDLLEKIEEEEGILEERKEREEREEKRFRKMTRTRELVLKKLVRNPNLSEEEKELVKNALEAIEQEGKGLGKEDTIGKELKNKNSDNSNSEGN